jgi:hypothetical protein
MSALPTMATALVAILLALVGNLVYGLFLKEHEDQIRRFSNSTTIEAVRRPYVRALPQAVRGEAAIADSRHLVILLMVACLAGSLIPAAAATILTDDLDKARTMVAQSNSVVNPAPSGKTLEDYRAEFKSMRAELVTDERNLERDIRGCWRAAEVLYFAAWLGFILWRPYVQLRARFAHEVARFGLRIQGLATPDELVKLTESELAVRDEQTLRKYVDVMKAIASARGIRQLTKTFELWPTGPTAQK